MIFVNGLRQTPNLDSGESSKIGLSSGGGARSFMWLPAVIFLKINDGVIFDEFAVNLPVWVLVVMGNIAFLLFFWAGVLIYRDKKCSGKSVQKEGKGSAVLVEPLPPGEEESTKPIRKKGGAHGRKRR